MTRARVVLPRLCVSLFRFSGRRISATTTFKPGTKRTGTNLSGLLVYSFDRRICPHVLERVSLRSIVDQPEQEEEVQRGQEQDITAQHALLRVLPQSVKVLHPTCPQTHE